MERLNEIGLRVIKSLQAKGEAPRPTCKACNDTMVVVDEKTSNGRFCECRTRALIAHKVKQLMSEFCAYRDAKFDILKPRSADQGRILRLMKAKPHLAYWLEGETGTGKTYFLVAQYRECLINGELALWIGSEHELKEMTIERRVAMRSFTETKTAYPWDGKEQYRLFIDDLGRAGVESEYIEDVYEIINFFNRKQWPISLTTNRGERDLIDLYGGAFVRRLKDGCIRAPLGAEDTG